MKFFVLVFVVLCLAKFSSQSPYGATGSSYQPQPQSTGSSYQPQDIGNNNYGRDSLDDAINKVLPTGGGSYSNAGSYANSGSSGVNSGGPIVFPNENHGSGYGQNSFNQGAGWQGSIGADLQPPTTPGSYGQGHVGGDWNSYTTQGSHGHGNVGFNGFESNNQGSYGNGGVQIPQGPPPTQWPSSQGHGYNQGGHDANWHATQGSGFGHTNGVKKTIIVTSGGHGGHSKEILKKIANIPHQIFGVITSGGIHSANKGHHGQGGQVWNNEHNGGGSFNQGGFGISGGSGFNGNAGGAYGGHDSGPNYNSVKPLNIPSNVNHNNGYSNSGSSSFASAGSTSNSYGGSTATAQASSGSLYG